MFEEFDYLLVPIYTGGNEYNLMIIDLNNNRVLPEP